MREYNWRSAQDARAGERIAILSRCGHIPLLGLCTKKESRALIERPYSRGPQAVGAVYDRPGFFVQSPLLVRRGMRAPRHAVNSFTPSQPWANICCRFAVGEPLRGLFWLRGNIVGVSLIYDSRYLRHDTGLHPENARRLGAILRALDQDESLSHKLARTLPNAAGNE